MSAYVPKFKPKADDEDKYINILLLGESGVGKSTFINSFVNYLEFSSLRSAEKTTKLTCLIPTKFSVTNEEGDSIVLNFKQDDNEDNQLGNSSTQGAKAYVFPFESKMIRLIDTPGINDSRGAVTKDRENFENILDYIGQFRHLHAVCFLLKPDVTVLTAGFKYCLIELLSRLDRSAANNIAFLFTRTASTDYKAPDTLTCIRRVLDDIARTEKVVVPLRFKGGDQRNCFYFDNEGFKYLVARQQGVQIGNASRLKESWNVSCASSWGLVHYITGDEKHAALPPHNVQDTVSVNKARQLIFDLSKPLADITDLIQDNLDALKDHQARIIQENLSSDELRQMMYVPTIDLEETQLDQPVTVCAAAKCSEIYTLAGRKKYHYKQRCHNPCHLSGIQKEVIGDAGLVNCTAMGGTPKCKQCGCDFSIHMHVYYETETVESKIEDKTVQSQLATNAQIVKAQYDCIKKLEARVNEYKKEREQISRALATFAYFLRNNSICPINDAYEAYLDCLIQREKIALGSDKDLLARYESLKKEHVEQKRLLEEAGKMARVQRIAHVQSDQILALWERLKRLPHTGKKIVSLHRCVTENKRGEMRQNMEYVHTRTARRPDPRQEADDDDAATVASDVAVGGGAKKKNKKKTSKNMEAKVLAAKDLLDSEDYESAAALLAQCLEDQKREKSEEAKQKQQVEDLMKVIEALTTKLSVQEVASQNTQRGNAGKGGRGGGNPNRGRGGQNQYQNQNRAGNYQGRGSGGYNQNRGGQNNNRGRPYNRNQNQNVPPPQQSVFYHRQHPPLPPPIQQGYWDNPLHQPHHAQYQPYPQQNPNYGSYAQSPQQGFTYPGQPMQPYQVNINLTPNHLANQVEKPPIDGPAMAKYHDPPPAYSNVVDANDHVRSKTFNNSQQPQQQKARNSQFKKATPKKQPPANVNKLSAEDSDEAEDSEDSTVENMRQYLNEQRERLSREAAIRRPAPAPAPAPRNADEGGDDMFQKFAKLLMNLKKK